MDIKNMLRDFFKNLSVLKKIYLVGIMLVVPTILIKIVSTNSLVESQSLTWLTIILVALLLLMLADFVYALEVSNGGLKKSAIIRTIATMAVGLLCGGLAFFLV